MMSFLEPFERVEADDGYSGEDPGKIKSAGSALHNPTEHRKLERQRVRSRHETVNKRFKQFKCIQSRFRHNVKHHGDCFYAVAVLTQLMIENGHPLFQVEYSDAADTTFGPVDPLAQPFGAFDAGNNARRRRRDDDDDHVDDDDVDEMDPDL
jgi:hypothetical protein